MPSSSIYWDDDTIAELLRLWNQINPQLSTKQIADRMCISKNAVVGKAHRLNLSVRPSPIKRGSGEPATKRVHHVRVGTTKSLPPLASIATPPTVSALLEDNTPLTVKPRPEPEVRKVTEFKPRKLTACCWPIGTPGKRDFRFCDDTALSGKPYCQEHASIAYKKVKIEDKQAA